LEADTDEKLKRVSKILPQPGGTPGKVVVPFIKDVDACQEEEGQLVQRGTKKGTCKGKHCGGRLEVETAFGVKKNDAVTPRWW